MNITKETAHRPFSMPSTPWKFYQEWNRAIFLHWPVPKTLLQPYIPSSVQLDTCDGTAWISFVAFSMEKMKFRYVPSFPPISNFDELNLRTYVRSNGKSGVYFLSIEASKKCACYIAKAISELPYTHAAMQRETGKFSSKNSEKATQFSVSFTKEKLIRNKTTLDLWLTERYALFQENSSGQLLQFDIHHVEWPLYTIKLTSLDFKFPKFEELLNTPPVHAHYSPGVQVIAWDKNTVHATAPLEP